MLLKSRQVADLTTALHETEQARLRSLTARCGHPSF
jgi:hypothetical protein